MSRPPPIPAAAPEIPAPTGQAPEAAPAASPKNWRAEGRSGKAGNCRRQEIPAADTPAVLPTGRCRTETPTANEEVKVAAIAETPHLPAPLAAARACAGGGDAILSKATSPRRRSRHWAVPPSPSSKARSTRRKPNHERSRTSTAKNGRSAPRNADASRRDARAGAAGGVPSKRPTRLRNCHRAQP